MQMPTSKRIVVNSPYPLCAFDKGECLSPSHVVVVERQEEFAGQRDPASNDWAFRPKSNLSCAPQI